MAEEIADAELQLARVELQACLDDPTTSSVLLSGEWGVGKTTFIKQFMEARQDFLYVSAFGAASISDLQSRISIAWIEKSTARVTHLTDPQEIGVLKRLLRRALQKIGTLLNAAWSRLNLPHLMKILSAQEHSAFVSEFLVHDSSISILVVDDIERTAAPLRDDKTSLLGFIDSFRLRSGKRLVLVGNRTALFGTESSKEAAEEKAIDFEIAIKSSPQRIFQLALLNRKLPDLVHAALYEFVSAAGTKNIRLLKRSLAYFYRLSAAVEAESLLEDEDLRDCALMYAALVLSKLDYSFPLSWKQMQTILNNKALFSSLSTDSGKHKDVLTLAQRLRKV